MKHRQLVPTMGPLANGRQKNSMAPLDDNLVLEKGTSFSVGSWIFVNDGSDGFRSCFIDQGGPKIPEATSHHKINDFIDQLEEVGLSVSNSGTRIRRN